MATNITANVALNISELLAEKKISSEGEFARLLGVSKQLITKWKARNTYDISKITELFPDVSHIWLLTGEGEMLKSPADTGGIGSKAISQSEVEVVPMEQYVEVPFYDLSATAGMPSGDVQQTGWLETRLIPRQYAGREYAVIRISGDSMDDGTSRSLCHGDEIIVKQELVDHMTPLPIRSKLFVVDTLEGAVVKQIVELNKVEGYVVLHSFNERYPDYSVPLAEVRGFYSVQCFSHKSIRF